MCLSHLRWDFVLQRPQHLMRRFARERTVIVWEEAIPCDHPLPYYEIHPFDADRVRAVRPRVPHWWSRADQEAALARMLRDLLALHGGGPPTIWAYTPMMWPLIEGLEARAVAYDCMDELSAFRFAPPELAAREAALMRRADVMFTGGVSLWEAKRQAHDNVHAMPSAVDAAHFSTARTLPPAAELAAIPGPRLGYYGVIDERLDLALVAALADARPDWSIVMVGPVVKVGEADLPRRPNIFWLGQRSYADLPGLLAGWDVALMPFALSEATRFISPTKTPEYLAGGVPVVSTRIRDVERSYDERVGVRIADTAEQFVSACAAALAAPSDWVPAADALLADRGWDRTFARMRTLLAEAERGTPPRHPDRFPAPGLRRAGAPYDVVVAGAGFAGSVMAERLASQSGRRVLLVDRRPHVGGNAYDHPDAAGLLIHRYGPHIFHTNSQPVADYLSRFTAWRPYEHRVLAQVGDRQVPMPINRTTLNALYGAGLSSDAEAAAFLAARATPVAHPRNARDVVVGAVGQDLYETFFRGYTRKQWGRDPSELDRSVTARVPTRTNTDDRYFTDSFQAMPREGFTRMFERMLDHPLIDLALGADFFDLAAEDLAPRTVFTGPIDGFFGHRLGHLPYRSLRFEHETLPVRRHQAVAVVNYPDPAVPFTRVTEWKHLTGQSAPVTSITREVPTDDGDPYYPIPCPENAELLRRYEALAAARPDVTFLGRLGSYRYYNMDQVVAQALAAHRRLAESGALGVLATPTAAE